MNFRIGVLIMSLALLGSVGCTKPSQTGDNSAAPSSDNSSQANSPSPAEKPAAGWSSTLLHSKGALCPAVQASDRPGSRPPCSG